MGDSVIDVRTIIVTRDTSVRDALAILAGADAGILLLVRSDGTFERSVTDEDLKRLTLHGQHGDELLSQLPEAESRSIGGWF
jgi:CBS domain-containing protein